MKTDRVCVSCENKNPMYARYCIHCGKNLQGIKSKITGIQKKITYQSKDWMTSIRNTLDGQIYNYLEIIDNNKQLRIGGVNIPDNRKGAIRNALISFKGKISPEKEPSEEFNIWKENLPHMLSEQKCIVCFSNWKSGDDIVVCKYCQSGGHQEHLVSWIRDKHSCPLCRQKLQLSGLLAIKID